MKSIIEMLRKIKSEKESKNSVCTWSESVLATLE
jgi:hypothetical protein